MCYFSNYIHILTVNISSVTTSDLIFIYDFETITSFINMLQRTLYIVPHGIQKKNEN